MYPKNPVLDLAPLYPVKLLAFSAAILCEMFELCIDIFMSNANPITAWLGLYELLPSGSFIVAPPTNPASKFVAGPNPVTLPIVCIAVLGDSIFFKLKSFFTSFADWGKAAVDRPNALYIGLSVLSLNPASCKDVLKSLKLLCSSSKDEPLLSILSKPVPKLLMPLGVSVSSLLSDIPTWVISTSRLRSSSSSSSSSGSLS